jgi:hypothetical protein
MDMKVFIIPFIFSALFLCCNQPKSKKVIPVKTIDQHLVDSLVNNSDSSYVKPYKRIDFVNAFFYVNKKDSSVSQLMKDSSGRIRQIIIARKNIRTFFAQYYSNGQLQADLPLDAFGQYHGTATYYYENSHVQNSGDYVDDLKNGKWENYDEKGKLLSTDEYDSNGQLLRPAGKN